MPDAAVGLLLKVSSTKATVGLIEKLWNMMEHQRVAHDVDEDICMKLPSPLLTTLGPSTNAS